MKAWSWVVLIVLVILIKLSSLSSGFIETYYSTGIYPFISRLLRILFGWIPISMGDLFYAFVAIVILVKLWQVIRVIFKRKFNRRYFFTGLKQTIFFGLLVYVFFYLLWGLNYSRKGIARQLKLATTQYNVRDYDTLLTTLTDRLNYYAARIDTTKRDSSLKKSLLYSKSVEAYKETSRKFSFLKYNSKSIKVSLYTPVSSWFGFSGYYNPFSGEAQIQSRFPDFLRPFVITHEIGHQLGYAKEDEASFCAFISCRAYDDVDFRYSMYFDIYLSASIELMMFDYKRYRQLDSTLHPLVKRDYRAWRNYLSANRNPIEPYVSRFYDSYLKANNQPLGKRTYNMVTYWLIAYYKKYGIESL